MYDIIIIGAGPAGVSAALYAKARGKNILLLEKEKIGGLISNVSKVSHYASVTSCETGPEFAKKLEDQLKYSDIQYKIEKAEEINKTQSGFVVKTNKSSYECKKLICACGSSLKELSIANNSYTKHWPLGNEKQFSNKTVIVNGGSDGACKEALYIAKYAKQVHIVQNQDSLLCIDEFKKQILASKNITVHTSSELKDIVVENATCVKAVLNNQEICDKDGIEIYVQIGQNGNVDMLKNFASIENTFLAEDIKSNTEGLYFAGDIRVKPVKQIATAVCDGCLAAISACK